MIRNTELSTHILAGDLELMLNLPQPKTSLAQQVPTYAASALRLFQPYTLLIPSSFLNAYAVLYLRTFGLFMMFLTNKAFKFLISQISKSSLCVCLLALLSISLLGIFFFWLPS